MLTGNDDSLDDSYKLITLLVKLMTRAGIVSRFMMIYRVRSKPITNFYWSKSLLDSPSPHRTKFTKRWIEDSKAIVNDLDLNADSILDYIHNL
jgi:hypothetical protein